MGFQIYQKKPECNLRSILCNVNTIHPRKNIDFYGDKLKYPLIIKSRNKRTMKNSYSFYSSQSDSPYSTALWRTNRTLPMSSHTQPIRTPDATACTSLGAQTGTHGTPSVRNARSYEANMPADGTANECCHLI